MKRLLAAAVLLAASPAAAQGLPGDPEAGRALAERLCADCHVVGAVSTGRAAFNAPSFQAIATNSAMTELSLRTFLAKPHSTMPNLALTRREIDDAIALLLSLRGR